MKSEPRQTVNPAHIWLFFFFFSWLTATLTVLTGDSPVAWATHTCSGFPQARVTIGTMLETGLVTVAAPQAL